MKNTLLSILTITAITTASWADITTEQLDSYMKASGADVMLDGMKEQLGASMQQRAKMGGKSIPSDVLEAMTAAMTEKEVLAKFTDGIKSLDEKDYKALMKFYSSDLGKKSADIIRNTDMIKMQKEMAEFAKKVVPEDRKKLLSALTEASMSEKRQMNMTKTMMMSAVSSMPKEMQEQMKTQMEAQLEQMKPMLKEQITLMSAYTYRNYSDSEVKEMTKHYKLSSTEAEVEAIIKGSSSYMSAVMPKIIEVVRSSKEKDSK